MKSLFLIIIFLFLFGFISTDLKAEDTIKVGIILPLTGQYARFGKIEKQSFEMAVEEINEKGGIKGKSIELLIEDTLGNPVVGRSAVQEMIRQDKVVMIGGGYNSSVTYTAASVAVKKGFPFLVNTGSVDKITEPWSYTPSGLRVDSLEKQLERETHPGKRAYLLRNIEKQQKKADKEARKLFRDFSIFRLNPPASEYASGLESFLAEVVKAETAAILYENSFLGKRGASAFDKSCKRLGITVIMKESYDAGSEDFKPLLARVKESDPDIVYMISFSNDASLIMLQSRELKMNPKLFAGTAGGFAIPQFSRIAGKSSEKVVSGTLWHESLNIPGAKEYFDNFKKRYDKNTEYHGAEAYSAMYVIADVLKRAQSHEPQDIRQALAETDMMTVFGPVKFISYGKKINQNRIQTYVLQWIDGKLRVVWPSRFASTDYVYPIDWINERQ